MLRTSGGKQLSCQSVPAKHDSGVQQPRPPLPGFGFGFGFGFAIAVPPID
jgi:hypothetical protein